MRSCLVSTPKDDGYQVHLQALTNEPLVCFIMWENHRYIEKVTRNSSYYFLHPGFSTSGIRWRCDLASSCTTWMKSEGLCRNSGG